ncbi:Protein OS-9 [Spathaspora sp. JA1]|nr:Protein OS-9 [Spathaspora sp. JA1]
MIVNWSLLLTLYSVVHVTTASNPIHKSSNRITFENGYIPRQIAESFVNLNEQIKDKARFEILNMHTQHHNGSYLCHIPVERKIDLQVPKSGTTPMLELKRKALGIIQQSFTTTNCTFAFNLHDRYWTIGYCYGDKVIQFHEDWKHYLTGEHEAHFPQHVYTLARFPGSEAVNKNTEIKNQAKELDIRLDETDFTIFDGEYSYFSSNQPDSETNTQKFIKHTLLNGEICDLTMKPRTIDIVYKCDQSVTGPVKLLQFQEIKTCQYQMIIHVPGLCGLEEFRRNIIQDNVVDLECKKIYEKSNRNEKILYDDYFRYSDDSPSTGPFLASGDDLKINLHDYSLNPCGAGYFLGTRKKESETETGNPYWDNRRIFIYSGSKLKSEPEQDFGRMLVSVLEQKIPSPLYNTKKVQVPLSWNDTFTMWYELYDYTGNFITLFRINREGKSPVHSIGVESFDRSMLENYGMDRIIVGMYDAPNDNWNFQRFSRPRYTSVAQEPKIAAATQTITVTVTSSEVDIKPDDDPAQVLQAVNEELERELLDAAIKEYLVLKGKNEVEIVDLLDSIHIAMTLAKQEEREFDLASFVQETLNLEVDTDAATKSDSSTVSEDHTPPSNPNELKGQGEGVSHDEL